MKYFAKKIRNEYGEFDSKAEFERFLYLKEQEDIGVISDLQRQVKFEIIPKLVRKVTAVLRTKTKEVDKVEEKAAHYTADFCYTDYNGQYVIEELKGGYTKNLADYVLRRKLIKQLIHRHNEDACSEEWVFKEIVATIKKKRK